MSSHSPQNRAFSITHQRIILELQNDGTINAITQITILPLSNELVTVHLHSSHSNILSVYHPNSNGPELLNFILNEPNFVQVPDPNSIRQFPEAKRRLFERINEKETGELVIEIDRSKIIRSPRSSNNTSDSIPLTSNVNPNPINTTTTTTTTTATNLKDSKEIEFDPISIHIEYQITSESLDNNPAICQVQGEYPQLFTNSISARSWVPCLDSLWERCPWELEFIVPKSTSNQNSHPITVVASGELIEQITHPTDPSKVLFHYSQAIPSSVQHIAWVIGALKFQDLIVHSNALSPNQDNQDSTLQNNSSEQESCTQIKLLAFFPPNRQSQLINTVKFLPHALSFFTQEFGSYPYSSYKVAFLDMSNATHSIGATFNSTTLTLYPADLLYPQKVIDQVFETKPIIVQALASQWIGINIIPKSPSDTWLINGLSLYITGLYLKSIWGSNDYRYRIKKDIIKCVEMDVNKPPICQPGLPLSIDTEVLGFVNLKASLVLYILDRHLRRTGGGTSLGLSRVIPKIFLSAITGEMRDNMLSTTSFLRICRKLNGIELKLWADQWIYSSGCPVFQVSAYFNRKKLTHELSLKQSNRSKFYYDDDQTSWSEKCNLKPIDRFEGQMTIRIHESDGIPYEHVLDIKESFKRYELPSNHRTKKFKRSSRRYGSTNLLPDGTQDLSDRFTYKLWERSQKDRDRWKVEDWTEEDDLIITTSSVEWIRWDVELEWICEFKFEMKEFMWIEQLQRDRDPVAQLEAVRALKSLPSKVVCSHLCRTVLTPEYFFRIRVEAVLALVSCANTRCNFLGLFHLLKLFQTRYCYPPKTVPTNPWNIRAIPKPNQFDNFTEYFIRKALVIAISRVRDQNHNSPAICQQFFLDQLIYNDNSLNLFSDTHYLATTISALADCFIHMADNGERGESSELFGSKPSTDFDSSRTCDKRMMLMVNELERCFMADRLVPSYRNLIALAVVEAKLKLMLAGLLPIDLMFFLLCTRPGNYLPLRILAFDCLLLLRGFQEKAIIRYMFIVLRDDPSLLVRRRLAMGLVQCLPILVFMEELGVEPSDRTSLSVIDEPRQGVIQQQFDHKTVTKNLRAEVGRALILRECIMSVMLHPTIDTDVQTCLLKISEVLFKPTDESVPIRIVEEKQPTPKPPTPVLPKIRIPVTPITPIAAEIQPSPQAPLPKIILKDNHQHSSNEIDIRAPSPVPIPPAEVPPSKLAVALLRKPKLPPKPKKFQASGMSIPDHKMCQNLLKKLANHPLSIPFRQPVDPIREIAPNYFNVISNPMDFKTMGMKLEMGQYPNREAFKDDVHLIIKNCKTYNLPDSSLVVKYAEPMMAAFEKLWERSEKTMSAIQAKGLTVVNPSWLQPATDTKLMVTQNNVVPLAPPPSFAAFAAGGSMISPPVPFSSSSPAPVSPGLASITTALPSRMSPELSRATSGLKVKLKPRNLPSPVTGNAPEMLTGVNNLLASKSSLKIKFNPSAPTAFPRSSSSLLPAPPPPIVSIAPQKPRQPPPPPSFTPPPPPPTFESFSLASQTISKPSSKSIRHDKTSLEDVNLPNPSSISNDSPIQPKKPSPSHVKPLTDSPRPPSGSSILPAKKNHLIVQFPKPPSLPAPPPPTVTTISSEPNVSNAGRNLPTPLPLSLHQINSAQTPRPITEIARPPIPSLKPTANLNSQNPTKIKLVQKPIQRPQDQPKASVSSFDFSSNISSNKIKLEKDPKLANNTKLSSTQSVEPVTKQVSNLPIPPLQPSPSTKKLKTKKSISHPAHLDQTSGYRSTPPIVPPQTPDQSISTPPSHITGASPPSHPAAVVSSKKPTQSSVVAASQPTGRDYVKTTDGTDDSLITKKAKAIIRKMMEHPQGIWFRIPVDPIAVGAPTYLDEIKNPMDLSTMMKKLDNGIYKKKSEVLSDFDLMVKNCFQFNGEFSELAEEAKILKKAWLHEWDKANKLSYIDKRSVLGLFNRLHQVPGATNVFGEPVDLVKFAIPTYYAIIGGKEHARDLGTIKKKLNADEYTSINEIEYDIRLMLCNCFKFNEKNSPVAVVGQDLEKAFNIAIQKLRKDLGLPPSPPFVPPPPIESTFNSTNTHHSITINNDNHLTNTATATTATTASPMTSTSATVVTTNPSINNSNKRKGLDNNKNSKRSKVG